jgi:TonB family protein
MELSLKGLTIFLFVLLAIVIVGCQHTPGPAVIYPDVVFKDGSRCGFPLLPEERKLLVNVDRKPISTALPRYPLDAAVNGIEGYVQVEFDVSSEGVPINIHVMESYPSDVFVAEVLKMLPKWRYKPIAMTCNSIQMDFNL